MHGWHAFISSGSGSKSTFGKMYKRVCLIISPVRGPWCPSSREQEATWSTLKSKSRFWRQAHQHQHQLFKWSDSLWHRRFGISWKVWQLVAERCQVQQEEKPRRSQAGICKETSVESKPASYQSASPRDWVWGVGRLARHPVVVIFCCCCTFSLVFLSTFIFLFLPVSKVHMYQTFSHH